MSTAAPGRDGAAPPAAAVAGPSRLRGLRTPRLDSLFVAALVLFGFRLGVRAIGDNSMFTHLRTGAEMVGGRGIPRTDPYSFTAAGRSWVVQSWLPEWTYGWADRLGGFRLVVLEQALLCALLALVIVRLARAGSPLRTALAGGVAIGAGAGFWSPRPLLFGLLCMALLLTVVERRRSPWLLVPLVWLWVQSHGSFPLGLAWLGARAVGEWLDWRAWPDDAMRYVGGFVAGLAVSVVNPLGARLLVFPFTLAEKRSAFSAIVEWRSPDFQTAEGRFSLVFLVVALALLLRVRLSWRDLVPVVVFFGAALVAMRNLPVAAIVLAPVLGRALRRPEGAAPRRRPGAALPPPTRLRLNRALLATIVAAFLVFGASIWIGDPLRLSPYPEQAVTFMDRAGLLRSPHRVAHQDFVGNYLTLRYGRRVKVFVDDRYDMFPASVSADYRTLLGGREDSARVLSRHRIDVVVWEKDLALANILRAGAGWKQIYRDERWVVYQRV
ncbi:MAG TPA: hypothetical protein VHH09_02115 [Acidimicrobiales bacterium]|nr:hypothetical protein [Acidimicrobiales bacterium]